MNVFISWSQDRSKAIAQALHEWLPTIIQDIKPWMSEHNVEKGTRGLQAITKELDQTHFGIICLTPESLNAPWLLFEAGALSKGQDQARVWTFLYELEHTDVKGPLAQFQHTKAEKEDVRKLVTAINIAQGNPLITEQQLETAFNRGWNDFERRLVSLPNIHEEITPERSEKDMVKEVLELVRGLVRNSGRIMSELQRQNLDEFSRSIAERIPGYRPFERPNEQSQESNEFYPLVEVSLRDEQLKLQLGDRVISNIHGKGIVVEKGERFFAVKFDSARFSRFLYGEVNINKTSESAELSQHSEE